MIRFTHGDIFAQPAEAIVNPVNCAGVAGAGLALQFKRRHPDAFLAYRRACTERRLRPGRMFMFDTGRDRPRWIVHFPTKCHWRDRSAIEDIEGGLRDLATTIAGQGIRSIAIPPIGCGLGGLDWRAVRPLITASLADTPGTVIVLEPAPEAEPCACAGVRLREEREAMTRDTTSIFDHSATLVPDIVTEAEERRILLRISQASWMTDLSRRVQHYGLKYDYGSTSAGRHASAAPFPRWATAIGEPLRPFFQDALPEQCIVNEYRPGQGIGMHADHRSFGPVVVSLSLAAEWTMNFRPRSRRPYVRGGLASDEVVPLLRRASLVLSGGARSAWMHGIDPAANAGRSETRLSATFRTLVPPPFLSVPAARPSATRQASGQTADERLRGAWRRVNGKGTEREPARSSTHRHQPGLTGDESWLSD